MLLKYPTMAWKPVNGGTGGRFSLKILGGQDGRTVSATLQDRDRHCTQGHFKIHNGNLAGSLWVTSDGCVSQKTSGQTGIL